MSLLVKKGLSFIGLLVALGIIINSKQFFPPNFQTGFLFDKVEIFWFYKYALFGHIVSAPFAYIIALFQVIYPTYDHHKILGRTYMILVLFISAPSGLVMAFYALGGIIGKLLFLTLSILWWTYTFRGYKAIISGNLSKHQHLMLASFILANSAILLRLLSFIFNQINIWSPIDNYLISSFLSWVPLLIFHERRKIIKLVFK